MTAEEMLSEAETFFHNVRKMALDLRDIQYEKGSSSRLMMQIIEQQGLLARILHDLDTNNCVSPETMTKLRKRINGSVV